MSAMTKAQRDDMVAAREELRELISPGTQILVLQRHVARSGMTRWLDLYVTVEGGGLRRITEAAAVAMGGRTYLHDGLWTLKVGGCGMDMHFATVYGLSRSLWPDGYACTGLRCTSNDHSNDYGHLAREYNEAHPDAGDGSAGAREEYVAARQEWIAAQDAACYAADRIHPDGGYALTYRTL